MVIRRLIQRVVGWISRRVWRRLISLRSRGHERSQLSVGRQFLEIDVFHWARTRQLVHIPRQVGTEQVFCFAFRQLHLALRRLEDLKIPELVDFDAAVSDKFPSLVELVFNDIQVVLCDVLQHPLGLWRLTKQLCIDELLKGALSLQEDVVVARDSQLHDQTACLFDERLLNRVRLLDDAVLHEDLLVE